MLTACGGGDGNDNGGGAPPSTPAPGGPATPVSDLPFSYAVDGRLKIVGLGFTYEAFPIVLFRDGRALTDTVGLIFPAGLAAHRAQYPATWTQWRASGADVQILQADGTWKTITASNVSAMATGQYTVAGIYESLSVGASPSMTVISSSQYTFTHAGAFGKGSYTIGDTATVGAIATTPDRRGTYTVDGHRLTLTLENGTVEQHVIVFKETDANYIFIDGAMYSLR
ncbi:MAG: lipocalin family protein [Rhizobacter sp.]